MFRQTLAILTKNLRSILEFEIVYKLAALFLVFPLLGLLLSLVMNLTGHPYLEPSNLLSFLLNPLTILFLLFTIIFLTAYTMLDITVIILLLDQGKQNKPLSAWGAFCAALKKLKNLFNRQNILLPLVVLILLPFLDIGLSFGVNQQFVVPEFISDFILENTTLFILASVVIITLIIFAIRWLYSFHYYVLENATFKVAREKSRALIKNSAIKDALLLLFAQIFYIIFFISTFLLFALIVWGIDSLYQSWLNQNALIPNLIVIILNTLLALLVLMATPFIYALISCRFYQHKAQKSEKIHHVHLSASTPTHSTKIIRTTLTILLLAISGIFYFIIGPGKYSFLDSTTTPEIVAHRGFSAEYPANTMDAFRTAVEGGADWLELDVHETADNKIVISHDNNLYATSGIDKDIWNSTYDEIKDINVSGGRDEEFPSSRVPLFSELLEYASTNNVRLNIELKHSGHERNLEQATIDLIRQYRLEDRVILASLNFSMLEKAHSIAPEIPTLYIVPFAYGDISKTPIINDYSIEASWITPELVQTAHNANKKVYAWTVDNAEIIEYLQSINIDGIITNNPVDTRSVLEEAKTINPVFSKFQFTL